MLYLAPTSPSVSESLRLFRLLSTYHDDEDESLDSSHSENAQLFLDAPLWSAEDHFLFIIKIHQPTRLIDLSAVHQEKEIMKVQAFEEDMAQIRGVADPTTLHVNGPGDISSALHLAALRFLEVAFYAMPPSTGPYQCWKNLCIRLIQAGSDPCYIHELVGTPLWTTALAVALRRIVETLYKRQVGWVRSTLIIENALEHWSCVLRESGANFAHFTGEERLSNDRTPAKNMMEFPSNSSSFGSLWVWFTSRMYLRMSYTADRDNVWGWTLKVVFSEPDYLWSEYDDDNKNVRQALASRILEANSQYATCCDAPLRLMPGSFPEDVLPAIQSSAETDVVFGPLSLESKGEPREIGSMDGPDRTKVNSLARGLFDMSEIAGESSAQSWVAIHEILETSPQAEAYRRLRFGLKHPSRYDFGHGITCDCWECTASRDVVHRELSDLYDRYVSSGGSWGGGYGGGGGGGRQPRDPGNG
jgi:hypothetical protein